ncbi:MAG: SBBP repeat-containing protein [Bacteroidota bacterium]|nr:SBBP repeat-containing protein [Bacteroidota bacterium]
MKKLISLSVMTLIALSVCSQDFDWAVKAGGNESDQGYDIASTAEGISYVTGWFSDTAWFGDQSLVSAGRKDVFLAKYGIDGSLVWVAHAPGAGSNTASGIATDPEGNVYITGWFEQEMQFGETSLETFGLYDMFVAKANPEGQFLWARQSFGEQDNYGNRLCINPEGDVIVAGSFRHVVDFGNEIGFESEGDRDIFIANYSTEGDIQWVKQFGGPGEDRAYGIETDAGGNIFFTGFFNGTISFKELIMYSPAITSSYIAKLNPAGSLQWARRFAGGANDFSRGFGLGLDEESNVYSTGFFSGTLNLNFQDTLFATGGPFDLDIFLAKHNTEGELVWALNAGGVHMDQGRDLEVDPNGNTYLTGFFNSLAEFGMLEKESFGMSDVFVAKFNPEGEITWLLNAGGTLADFGFGISTGADSSAYICGAFTEDAFFGDISLEGWNLQDIFIARVDPSGTFIYLNHNDQQIRIYPNPVDEKFSFRLGKDNFLSGEMVLRIHDAGGRLVEEQRISQATALSDHLLDTSTYRDGAYILTLLSSGKKLSIKFIVKHR